MKHALEAQLHPNSQTITGPAISIFSYQVKRLCLSFCVESSFFYDFGFEVDGSLFYSWIQQNKGKLMKILKTNLFLIAGKFFIPLVRPHRLRRSICKKGRKWSNFSFKKLVGDQIYAYLSWRRWQSRWRTLWGCTETQRWLPRSDTRRSLRLLD